MNSRRNAYTTAGLMVFLMLLAGGLARAQEAVSLAPRYEQDGKWFVRAATRFELDVATEDPEGKRGVHSLIQTREEKYLREFTEVQGESPTRQQLTYMVSREAVSTDPTVRVEPTKTGLEDRVITIAVKGDGQEVRAQGEPLSESILASVQARERVLALLPTREVAPGDSWNVEGADVGRFLVESYSILPDQDSSVICQFRDLRDEGGSKMAVVSILLSLKGRTKPEGGGAAYDMKLDMAGELKFDVTKGRPRSLSLNGTLKTAGAKTGSYGETLLKVDGNGIVKYDLEIE